jgi:hypothetical protein
MASLRTDFDRINADSAGPLSLDCLQILAQHCLEDVKLVLRGMRAFTNKAAEVAKVIRFL